MPRSILVTGGSTGIGRAVAEAFARQGDAVHITGRRAATLAEAAAAIDAATGASPTSPAVPAPVPVTTHVCDHTAPDAVAALAAALPESVDVLINNAGGVNGPDTGDDLRGLAEAWRWQLDTNLMTAVLTTEALSDRLASGGAIVHIGSIAADKGASAYGAAKAALASWNVGLARALGPRDITSNVIAPGYIEATEFFGDAMTEVRRTTLIDATFTGRAGRPGDIAGTAVFLASAGARYVTGQTLNVNGGAWPTR